MVLRRTLLLIFVLGLFLCPDVLMASEADLLLPDLAQVSFQGVTGHNLLLFGLGVCVLGMLFGMGMYVHLRNLPVHRAMREISELIFETCKTYLITQGKFILMLEVLIGAIIVIYYGWLRHMPMIRVFIILLFSLIGIA